MRVLVATHPAFAEHTTGAWHPERPDRLMAARAGIVDAPVDIVDFSPSRADLELLSGVHLPDYIRSIEGFCAAGGGHLDPDTVVGVNSWDAALRAAATMHWRIGQWVSASSTMWQLLLDSWPGWGRRSR
jgi:acetoin utilization deacetylase AcuC-like enzyme